jgi:hypothetical protein
MAIDGEMLTRERETEGEKTTAMATRKQNQTTMAQAASRTGLRGNQL